MTKQAVIMAGGTGGHIFPGLALAEKLQAEGWAVDWIGTADRMEADIVPKHNIKLHFIDVKGVRGNGLLRLLKAPFMLIHAWWQARKILKHLRPEVVFGFGGYASGPGGIAAWTLGVPLIIHEQNAVLGMTNRYLAKIAKQVFVAFPLKENVMKQLKAQVVGNPVRSDIAKLHGLDVRPLAKGDQINILVIGGSLGARALNQMLPQIFCQLIEKGFAINVTHQVGKGNAETVAECYKNLLPEFQKFVQINEFIDDMPTALSDANLLICRAGALTVSELAASGNVGIFVPLPIAVDDHQTANAKWLADNGAGEIVQQAELTSRLPELLHRLLSNPEQINLMQVQAKQQAILTTTDTMYHQCCEAELRK